jgi:hypothetical protein
MSKNTGRILIFIVLFALSGCSFARQTVPMATATAPLADTATQDFSAGEEQTPKPPLTSTFTPRPTATETGTPTATPTYPPVTLKPTYLYFLTVSPTPTLNPNNLLVKFESPPPLSKLISPIEMTVLLAPDYVGLTHIELIGEDGRELYSKVFRTHNDSGYYTRISMPINFEIKGAAEVARLQVSTYDVFGRPQAFNSMHLMLLSIGETQLNPFAPPVKERVLLRSPLKGQEVTGGVIEIEGDYQPANTSPLIVELINEKGAVIASRVLNFDVADGSYLPFKTSIPYTGETGKRLDMRLTFRQSDDRIPGPAYLFSVPLYLKP